MGVALRILGAFSSNENPPQQQQQEKSGGIGFSVEEKVKYRAFACVLSSYLARRLKHFQTVLPNVSLIAENDE